MTVICCDDFVSLCDFGAFVKRDQSSLGVDDEDAVLFCWHAYSA